MWGVTVTQGTTNYILVAIRITIWMKEFLKDSLFTIAIPIQTATNFAEFELSECFLVTTHPPVDERIGGVSDESQQTMIGNGIAIGSEFDAVRQ